MFSPSDTIVAIATPPGRGGIGVVRISGPDATRVALAILDREQPLAPRHATFTRVVEAARPERSLAATRAIDQVIATYFPAPHSYTAEDVVEISAHGSPVLLRAIVCAAMRAGARLAQPGEFTLRAFLHGRIDLLQAEAIADLINAATPLQARVAFDQLEGTLTARLAEIDAALFDLVARLEASLDFPDEGYHFIDAPALAHELRDIATPIAQVLAGAGRGRLIREGRQIVILGRTNTGKSTLFNSLIGADRAIVTDIAGTTRDLVTETADIGGVPVTIVDTAGIHESVDVVESEGVRRARGALSVADVVIVVLDRSRPLDPLDHELLAQTAQMDRLIVLNKADLQSAWSGDGAPEGVVVSLKTGTGLDRLREGLHAVVGTTDALRDAPAVSNIRHIELLERARAAIDRAADAAAQNVPEEFVLADLRAAREAFEDMTGRRTPDDVLRHIFERFCIGK